MLNLFLENVDEPSEEHILSKQKSSPGSLVETIRDWMWSQVAQEDMEKIDLNPGLSAMGSLTFGAKHFCNIVRGCPGHWRMCIRTSGLHPLNVSSTCYTPEVSFLTLPNVPKGKVTTLCPVENH
jgi:hypothetical protein